MAQTAVAKGLITATDAARLTDERKFALILEAGFSTRDTVSHISGRGVGLDVVNAAVTSLKGQLDIHSESGLGMRFTLRLPGLIARERGLRVTTAGRQFVLPMNAMERTLFFRREDLAEVDGETCLRVDGQAIPVRELSAVLGLTAVTTTAPDLWHALILTHGKSRVALVVDAIGHEDEIVIKPLRAPLLSAPNIKGAT